MKTNKLCYCLILTLTACSSSSNSGSSGTLESPEAGDTQSLRLISRQVSISDGRSSVTTYQYDETGHLIGLEIDGQSYIYDIDSMSRILSVSLEEAGAAERTTALHYYDPIAGLRRIDYMGTVDSITNLGVSSFDLYKFNGNLATGMERRHLLFEEIVLDAVVDDSAGFLMSNYEFVYDGLKLIQVLIDNNADGVVDTQRDFSYNADGTVSSALETGASQNAYVFVYEQGACNNNWGNSTHRYFCVPLNGL